ncbi:serine/threonine-protein phosphatase [Nocardiopsis sp. ARC36]
MGHDTAAGLIANLAVGAFRNERRRGVPLEEIPRGVENTLIQEFVQTRFATAILAELNLSTGELRWVNCGHLPPVLIRGRRSAHWSATPPTPWAWTWGCP